MVQGVRAMELIVLSLPCVCLAGLLSGIYHWITQSGNPMDDLVMSGFAINALLFVAILLVNFK